jgi:hypothetical protein
MRTFIILFFLGFFVSCASNTEKKQNDEDFYTNPAVEFPSTIR